MMVKMFKLDYFMFSISCLYIENKILAKQWNLGR